MTRIISRITRALALTPDSAERTLHFHGGEHGAYVCERAHCVSPGLDVRDS